MVNNANRKTNYPQFNKISGKWEIWDFAYEENGEDFYEVHPFHSFADAIEYWKVLNPKKDKRHEIHGK